MPCYHLDSHFPRGKSLCKCLVCIETLTLCFVTGNCRRSLLVIRSVRRSGMYSQSSLPRLSPTGCSLSERVFVTSSRLRVFYIIQYKFRFVKCFFVNNRGCKKRTPFYLPPPSISRLGTVVVCASASLASTDAGFAKPCIKPPSDVDETSPAIIVSSTTIRFAFTVSALSG